jgi:predicted RNase H-like HicB family nuclease
MRRTYAIVIEDAGENFSAYAPDVPGCAATGATVEETIAQMREALEFHFEGLAAQGAPIPEARAHVATIAVGLPAPAPAR